MPVESSKSREKRDWRISAILAAVWIISIVIVLRSGIEIPGSMLLVATIFFVLLIPSMNDLVRNIERAVGREPGAASNGQDSSIDRD